MSDLVEKLRDGEDGYELAAADEIERMTAELDAARAKLAQYEQAPVDAKTLFTYQRTFDAIAAAVTPNAVGLGISVKKFIEAFGPINPLIARPEVTK